MEFGLDKCATIILKRGKLARGTDIQMPEGDAIHQMEDNEEYREKDLSAKPKRVIRSPERYMPSCYNFQHFRRGRPRGHSPYSGVVTRSHTPRESESVPQTQYHTPRREATKSL